MFRNLLKISALCVVSSCANGVVGQVDQDADEAGYVRAPKYEAEATSAALLPRAKRRSVPNPRAVPEQGNPNGVNGSLPERPVPGLGRPVVPVLPDDEKVPQVDESEVPVQRIPGVGEEPIDDSSDGGVLQQAGEVTP